METINASITYPLEAIESFADRLGYNTVVVNPAYSESINDETNTMVGNGEPETITNPETRLDFVKRKFKEHSVEYFTQFSLSEADKLAQAAAKEAMETYMDAAKAQVEAAITI